MNGPQIVGNTRAEDRPHSLHQIGVGRQIDGRPSVFNEAKSDMRMPQRQAVHGLVHMGGFCRRLLEKLTSCRDVIEEIFNPNFSSLWAGSIPNFG